MRNHHLLVKLPVFQIVNTTTASRLSSAPFHRVLKWHIKTSGQTSHQTIWVDLWHQEIPQAATHTEMYDARPLLGVGDITGSTAMVCRYGISSVDARGSISFRVITQVA